MATDPYDVLQAISLGGVQTPGVLMPEADTLLQEARSSGSQEAIGGWLSNVSLVTDLIRKWPEGAERDAVERWLLVQWKQPEWVER